jgi:hypothetical protein
MSSRFAQVNIYLMLYTLQRQKKRVKLYLQCFLIHVIRTEMFGNTNMTQSVRKFSVCCCCKAATYTQANINKE